MDGQILIEKHHRSFMFFRVKVVQGGCHEKSSGVKFETLRLLYISAQITQMMAFTQIMVIWIPWRSPT